jgi:hypothetical protein
LNNFTKGNSTVTLSQGCIEKIKEEKNLQNLLIFIAAIKKEGSISTQVEYSFYNPTPEFINEKLNVSDICSNPKNPGNDLNKRKLEVSQEWINNDNYTIGIDEVIINVEVNLTSYMKNIDELSKQNINILILMILFIMMYVSNTNIKITIQVINILICIYKKGEIIIL